MFIEVIKVSNVLINDCTIEELSEESSFIKVSICSIDSFILENWIDAVHPEIDLFFLYRFLERLLWSDDNVLVRVVNCSCNDVRVAIVEALKLPDCSSEVKELDTSVTSDIVLDTADDKAKNM